MDPLLPLKPFSLKAMYHNLLVWRRQDVWRAPGAASPTINPAFIRRRQLYTTFLAPDTLKGIQDVLILFLKILSFLQKDANLISIKNATN